MRVPQRFPGPQKSQALAFRERPPSRGTLSFPLTGGPLLRDPDDIAAIPSRRPRAHIQAVDTVRSGHGMDRLQPLTRNGPRNVDATDLFAGRIEQGRNYIGTPLIYGQVQIVAGA
ncbi:MAG TPA: hypothetical protein VMW27_05715 [Thermoanaerobaculia bacterium]|nr:hypothetical protein [Thermoanaerobaculia bacterium]